MTAKRPWATILTVFVAGAAVGAAGALWFAAHGYSPIGTTALQERMLRQDFESAVNRAKLAVSETWLATGRAPTENLLAGLHEPESFAGHSLQSLTVGEGGRIVLRFDIKTGIAGGEIVLVPDPPAQGAGTLRWRCSTSSYPAIERVIPDCRFNEPSSAVR